MSRRMTVAPVTRIEGHLSVKLDFDESNRVRAAFAAGELFRGFEGLMLGRDPRDAIHLTQRICGVCPIPHARASVEAVERAFGIEVGSDAVLLRNLVQGAGLISDHLLHFYQLALLDYVQVGEQPPFTPVAGADLRFQEAEARRYREHYLQALEARRLAQEMGALFAGKLPHVMTFVPGGLTQTPSAAQVKEFRDYLDKLIPFIEKVYIPDVVRLSEVYPDYLRVGAGPANLLSFGTFPDPAGKPLFSAGRYVSEHGKKEHGERDDDHDSREKRKQRATRLPLTPVDVSNIRESTRYTHRLGGDRKKGAYSWVKAPRLRGEVYQVGALPRMIISGDYHGGLSVMDRLLASAWETGKVGAAMRGWLDQLKLDGSAYREPSSVPAAGAGWALMEAPRGALGHWLEYAQGKITKYEVIPPTAWNASPRDESDEPGPLEQALTEVRVTDRERPIEVYRVIHSFDPCMGCAVH